MLSIFSLKRPLPNSCYSAQMSKKRKINLVGDDSLNCIFNATGDETERRNKFILAKQLNMTVQREGRSRRRNGIFVNLVRTKNAESLSFKNVHADSEKHISDMVSDMQEGWNGMNQIAGDRSARLVVQNFITNFSDLNSHRKNMDDEISDLNKTKLNKEYKSHTYLIHVGPDTITIVDHELTSVEMINCLLRDQGWRNFARTILEVVPARYPGRTLVVEPIDDEIKKIKEYKEAIASGQGPCKIYRDIWALSKLNADIS